MKKFQLFDTETTGLFNTKDKPKEGIVKARDPMMYPEDYPRVFQLAFVLMDEEGTVLEEFSEFIKPDGWVIPTGPGNEFWSDHGYSTEECERLGVPIAYALDKFITAMDKADYLVAHNMAFDKPVILAEFARAGAKVPEGFVPPKSLCTMMSTIDYVKAPHSPENIAKWPFLATKWKYPKLEELHEKLFSEGFDGAHDALVDVKATFRCLNKIREIGLIRF